ncbi:MAG: hypothetical protein OJF62_001984 [Pseudolabrys sp.]|nr:hypothetical protein [Pseudolabrys sp.]
MSAAWPSLARRAARVRMARTNKRTIASTWRFSSCGQNCFSPLSARRIATGPSVSAPSAVEVKKRLQCARYWSSCPLPMAGPIAPIAAETAEQRNPISTTYLTTFHVAPNQGRAPRNKRTIRLLATANTALATNPTRACSQGTPIGISAIKCAGNAAAMHTQGRSRAIVSKAANKMILGGQSGVKVLPEKVPIRNANSAPRR